MSTYKEPVSGWIDNLYGPTGIAVGTVSGLLRVALCDESKLADVVPVDTCVSGLIAAAWDTAAQNFDRFVWHLKTTEIELKPVFTRRKAENIPVYNYVSSVENPMTWGEFKQLNLIQGIHYTSSNAIWCPYNVAVTSRHLYTLLIFLLHIIPAALVDLVSLLSGKKPS